MDKYTRYLIRQHFLNQMIPPLESHKVFGSHFLYDVMNMYIFFKFKPSNTTNPNTDFQNKLRLDGQP